MHYLDEGPRDAPPVLMLHGNPTWSFYYRNLVLALRDRFRCIVPDHVGCGLSDKPGDADYAYRLERRIADLDRLMDHLALERPLSLVVHDWGGMIGFGWAAARPEAISRTVILNTAAFRMPADKKFPPALWFAGRTRPGALLVRALNAFSGIAAQVAFKKPVSREIRRCYTGPYDSWANRIATLRFVQDIPLRPSDPGYDILADTEAHLGEFAGKPALLGWGERDFVFDRIFLRRWRELLPDAEVHAFADCGHYVLEDAGDALVRPIGDFLDRHETPGG
ncbi:MAG: alpha/beta fold hydrolase [Xanthomonadales bacterium]|nr:alpha/beta fold hydrolase [Xanthomonadales bacterium]NIX12632.1 alpha/beta fold hydrolase [Xanthomonadales bacterium]